MAAKLGSRIGAKRSDMRFRAPDQSEWDSQFEWSVYDIYRKSRLPVRRTVQGGSDTFSYTVPVRAATCDSCSSTKVSKHRKYTPDLFHDGLGGPSDTGGYHIEVKGYLRATQRSLLRAFCKARKDVSLRIIYQRDFPISKKSTISQWTSRFLKIPYAIWKGAPIRNWNL